MATVSTTALFGRAYELDVQTADGRTVTLTQNSWEPEALRMTFDVLECANVSPWWYADISVYNMTDPLTIDLILNATYVTLSAGYQTGPNKSSVIWQGKVLQVLFDRENVVDLKVTFHCIATIPLLANNVIALSQGAFSSQAELVAAMVAQVNAQALPGQDAYSVTQSQTIQQKLQAKQYPRGKTIFRTPDDIMRQIAQDNAAQLWISQAQHFISEMDSGSPPPAGTLTYSPMYPPGFSPVTPSRSTTYSVIGVPRQTPFGVLFRVLLDPRLKVKCPPILATLDRTVIQQMKQEIGQVVTPLDQNLTFIVAQLRHIGDTRGNDWYTEVTGYNRAYAQGLLSSILTPTGQGAN